MQGTVSFAGSWLDVDMDGDIIATFKDGDRVEVRKVSETASADFAAEATALPWAPPTGDMHEYQLNCPQGPLIRVGDQLLRNTARQTAGGADEAEVANDFWEANR